MKVGGFTSRRINVPGQVRCSYSSAIIEIEWFLPPLTIRIDDEDYTYHKKLCFVKSAMPENLPEKFVFVQAKRLVKPPIISGCKWRPWINRAGTAAISDAAIITSW